MRSAVQARPTFHGTLPTTAVPTAAPDEPRRTGSADEPAGVPVVQTAGPAAAAATGPASAPAGPGVAAAPSPGPGTGQSAQPSTDELVRRLFDPLAARLKAELRLDRERAGLITDLRR